jgi:S-adenosylmethionine-dependent methyltransferase
MRQVVRQELVWRQLASHLPPVGSGAPRAIDLGCGQGTQALHLARRGYEVVGVEEELLENARSAAAGAPRAVRRRLAFLQADLLNLPASLVGRFDAVCCHGVAMYLPLDDVTTAAVEAAREGGVVSVLTRNRAGIAMRAGMCGEWQAAVAGFDARIYRNRLGLDEVRADEPEEVARSLEQAGAAPVAWYGVRLFSDHFDDDYLPEDPQGLICAEEEAGRRDPYRRLTALTHTIAVKGIEGPTTR